MLAGAPLPLLLAMAAPNAVAFLVQASVSMAEIAFVARLGTEALAALALMFPGLMLMQMLANGAIGGAVSSAIARALGAGDIARAEMLVWHALAIALVAGFAFALAYWGGGMRLITAFGVNGDVAQAAHRYGTIVFGGAGLVWVMALMAAVLRGTGDMRFPALLMVAGAMVQVPLAGTLILGWFGVPRLGLQGAALATLTVSAVSVLVLLVRLVRARDLRLRLSTLRLQRQLFAAILRVGGLAALSPLFTVLTVMAVNALIGGFGVAALAGYGIVARLDFLLIPLVFGLGAAMTALVGVNVGAGEIARAERIGWLGGLTAAVLAGCVGLLLAVFPGLWMDLFTSDADIRLAGARFLQIVGPVFAFQGLGLALYFASQGAGTVAWPVLATVLRFVIGVGGAAVGVAWFDAGLMWIYACLAVGMFVYGALTAASLGFGAWRRVGAW
jgi:putative MATE family efflux protein